jgi:hypothetical protein
MGIRRRRLAQLFVVLASSAALPAWALDKQGSAHGGADDVAGEGQRLSGSLLFGTAFYNPSYAARPDNTGLALFRLAGHADLDLIGQHLSIPLDFNLFTDRTADGAGVLVPSELDLIGGVTSAWALPYGAIEFGMRGEADMGVDRSTLTQGYIDARARYLLQSDDFGERWPAFFRNNHFSSATTLGAFAWNPSYAARPDNTGLALFRYAERLGYRRDWFDVGVDFTFFTDRQANAVAPSELDFTADLGVTFEPFGVRVAYERDMPTDRDGLTQQFAFAYLTYSFGVELSKPRPVEPEPGTPPR